MSKIAGKLVNGLKTLAKNVTTKSFPQKDVKKFVTSLPTIKEVCGKEASKAVANQAKAVKNIDRGVVKELLSKPTVQNAVQEYKAVKEYYAKAGYPLPVILNNKMTLENRVNYLKKCFRLHEQRRSDLAKAFLGEDLFGWRFVK